MDVEKKLLEVEETLNELKDEIAKKNTEPVIGVKFPLENVGRLSTKTLFFKGNSALGEKVIIPNPSPFVVRNYGLNPVGIVVMNGNYAALMAEAEGFTVKDEAFSADDPLDLFEEDEDEEEDLD